MLLANITKYVVLSSDERIVRVLALNESLLLQQSFHFVNGDLTFHVPSDDKHDFLFAKTSEIETSNRNSLDFLVYQNADLLLFVVKKADRAIRASDCNQILKSCY